jgi:hypothetical protein
MLMMTDEDKGYRAVALMGVQPSIARGEGQGGMICAVMKDTQSISDLYSNSSV